MLVSKPQDLPTLRCRELSFSHSIMTNVRGTDGPVWSSWLCVVQLLGSHDEGQTTGHKWIHPFTPSPPPSSPFYQASWPYKCPGHWIRHRRVHRLVKKCSQLWGITWAEFSGTLAWKEGSKCQACSRLERIISKMLLCGEFHKHMGNIRWY